MRPYIICHMMSSIDGRIDCEMTEKIGGNEYYEALAKLDCPSLLYGRVTMQMHFALPDAFVSSTKQPIGQISTYCAAPSNTEGFTVAMDSLGSLQWSSNRVENRPLLVVTSEQASSDYFETLKKQNISWIAVGQQHIDLQKAVEIMYDQFGIKRLVLGGGGNINGAFLQAGLLDEVSLVLGAGIDGRRGMTAVFDGIADAGFPTTVLKLTNVERIGANSVWLRYKL